MTVPFVDLHRQYLRHQDELDAAMSQVISETAFISGRYAAQFEADFANWLSVEHVIGCANGTDAIEILLDAFGVGPGDEVLVPAMTWISTAEAVGTRGAKPVFVDVDETWTMDPAGISERITERTKGIIPVHLYGCPADMPRIMAIAEQHGLFVLEDCAQAHNRLRRRGRRLQRTVFLRVGAAGQAVEERQVRHAAGGGGLLAGRQRGRQRRS